MTLSTANGQTLRFSFALTSSAHGLLLRWTEIPAAAHWISSDPCRGALRLRKSPAVSVHNDRNGPCEFGDQAVFRGNLRTPDGVNAISQGNLDINRGGVMASSTFAGTLNAPDSNGRGNLSLSGGRRLSRTT